MTTLADADRFELLDQSPPPAPDPAMVLRAIAHVYDQRDGALETANRDDKQGLGLAHRNKRAFAAQEMLILLAELAHNLTIWARRRLGDCDPRFQKFGIQRLVRDVFQISGQATISPEQQVIEVVLNPNHPYAEAVERAFGRWTVALFAQKLGVSLSDPYYPASLPRACLVSSYTPNCQLTTRSDLPSSDHTSNITPAFDWHNMDENLRNPFIGHHVLV